MTVLMLMIWGVAGGFIYAAQALVMDLWNDGATRKDKTRALALFGIALFTAAVFSAGLTDMLRNILGHGVVINGVALKAEVDRIPVALTVGWSSNYLWPKVLRVLSAAIEKGPVLRNLP